MDLTGQSHMGSKKNTEKPKLDRLSKADDTLNIFWRQKQAPVVWCQKPRHTLPANDTGRQNKDKFRL